jgi:hypothetical protein
MECNSRGHAVIWPTFGVLMILRKLQKRTDRTIHGQLWAHMAVWSWAATSTMLEVENNTSKFRQREHNLEAQIHMNIMQISVPSRRLRLPFS